MIRSAIIINFFFLSCVLLFLSCENDIKVIEHLSGNSKLSPSESLNKVNLIYTDSGNMQFRLKAPFMQHYLNGVKEPYSEFTNGVYIEYYDKYQNVKTIIKANYAIRYDNTKKMEAKYKVEITNVNGELLKTEKITWDEGNNKIFTDEYVEITTKNEILKGKGMVANQDFSEWEIKEVTGSIPFDSTK